MTPLGGILHVCVVTAISLTLSEAKSTRSALSNSPIASVSDLGCPRCVTDRDNVLRLRPGAVSMSDSLGEHSSQSSGTRVKRSSRTNSLFRWGKKRAWPVDFAVGDALAPADADMTSAGEQGALASETDSLMRLTKRAPSSSGLSPSGDDMAFRGFKRIFRWGKRSEGGEDLERFKVESRAAPVFRWGKRAESQSSGLHWALRSGDRAFSPVFRWGKRASYGNSLEDGLLPMIRAYYSDDSFALR